MRHFKKEVPSGDLIAVYALSGRPVLDFTADQDKLQEAVSSLRWRPEAGHGGMQCPDVSFYIADLVINKGDVQALAALTDHTGECTHAVWSMAKNIALAAANSGWSSAHSIPNWLLGWSVGRSNAHHTCPANA